MGKYIITLKEPVNSSGLTAIEIHSYQLDSSAGLIYFSTTTPGKYDECTAISNMACILVKDPAKSNEKLEETWADPVTGSIELNKDQYWHFLFDKAVVRIEEEPKTVFSLNTKIEWRNNGDGTLSAFVNDKKVYDQDNQPLIAKILKKEK